MSKGRNPGFQSGNNWMQCDRCGFAYRRDQMKKTWDKLWVCSKDWEPRHEQDFVRAKTDKISPDGPIRPDDNGDTIAITTTGIPDGTFDNSL